MSELSDTEIIIREIREKFSNGLYVFVGLVKNKSDIFNKLKTNYSEGLREELENIINNQLVLIHYFERTIPEILDEIKRLLNDYGLKKDPKARNFLKTLKNAMVYALKRFSEYRDLIIKQQDILQKNPDLLKTKTKIFVSVWIKYEESQICRFFEKFDKIQIEEFNKYIRTVGLEIDRAIRLGVLTPTVGMASVATGAVFVKAIQAALVVSGAGFVDFPARASSLIEILFGLAGIAGAIYMAQTKFNEDVKN